MSGDIVKIIIDKVFNKFVPKPINYHPIFRSSFYITISYSH